VMRNEWDWFDLSRHSALFIQEENP
jgi:hypothetical protein